MVRSIMVPGGAATLPHRPGVERGELAFHALAEIPLRWVLRCLESLHLAVYVCRTGP